MLAHLGMHQDTTSLGVGIVKERLGDLVPSLADKHGSTTLRFDLAVSKKEQATPTSRPRWLASTVASEG